MNIVYIVLAIAVVAVVIGAVVIFRKQAGPVEEAAPRPSLEQPSSEQAKEAPSREQAEEAPAGAREAAQEPAPAAPEAEAPAEPVPEAPPKPEPTPEELKEEAEKLLAESNRMLDELRDLKSGEEDESANGTIEVLAEGLQEVKSLASRDKWAQAKEKAEALRSQLVMMLRSTRREQES